MVQEGGGGDSLRLQLVLETIAQLQGIEAASAKLRELGVTLGRARNSLGQLGESTGRTTESLKRTGAALSAMLQTGFGPRFIGSIQGVNAALISTGKILQSYAQTAFEGGTITEATARQLEQLSQEMIGVGVTGKATTQTIDNFIQRTSQVTATLPAGQQAVEALSQKLAVLKTQYIEAAQAAEARMNRALTGTQKAGQGLLLSFSLMQLAAGRLSQAFFGIGFAVLFTGFKFLNLITITVALTAALAGIGFQKLEGLFKGAGSAADRSAKRIEDFTDTLEEMKGETRLTAEALGDLAREGEDVAGVFSVKFAEIAGEQGNFLDRTISDWRSFFDQTGKDWESFFTRTAKQWTGIFGIGPTIGQTEARDQLNAELEETISVLTETAREGMTDLQTEFNRELSLTIALRPIVLARETLEAQFDSAREAVVSKTDLFNQQIRDRVEEQINDRRDALQTETDGIRSAGRAQTRAVRDTLAEQTEAIRDSLDDRLDIIRDNSEKQIEAAREAAEIEIEGHKEKIDTLQDQERELERTLSQLRSRRGDIISERIKAEAELATLEREHRRVGTDTTREQAILRARLSGLDAQQAATDKEIAKRKEAAESIEGQIEKLEILIEKTEEQRDNAIEAIRDQAEEQIEAARDVADEQIKEAQRAAEAQTDAIQNATQAATRAARDRADADIEAAQDVADARIAASEAIEDRILESLENEEQAQQDILDQQQEQIDLIHEQANALSQEVIPVLKEVAELMILAGTFPQIEIGQSRENQQRMVNKFIFDMISGIFGDSRAREIMKSLGMTGGFQLGGIIPGAIGQPRLVVAHGGEEVRTPAQQKLLPPGRPRGDIIFNVTVRTEADIKKIARAVNKELGGSARTSVRSSRSSRGFR